MPNHKMTQEIKNPNHEGVVYTLKTMTEYSPHPLKVEWDALKEHTPCSTQRMEKRDTNLSVHFVSFLNIIDIKIFQFSSISFVFTLFFK